MRNYPGKAVDATLTMDQSSAMGVLYEANWINAHESIKVPSRFLTQKNLNGISSLGNYQRTLEQIKAIEDKTKDENITKTIRELSGYKPSTLRRKNRRQYVEWDGMKDGDVKEKIKLTETGIKNNNNNISQTAEYNTYNSSNGIKKEKNLKNDKGLRRSQTVIIQDGTLDVKDLFQRKQKLKQQQQQIQLNCDKSGYVNVKNLNQFCDVNKKLHDYEVIDDFESNSHDYEPVIFKNNIKNNKLIENRMSSYNSSTEPILISSIRDKKINPVSRNKSVRINSSISPQKIENGTSPKTIEVSPIKTHQRSGLKKLIYNTISAGTKYPKEFLKHINSNNNNGAVVVGGVGGGGNDTPQLNDIKLKSYSPTRLTTIVSGTTPPSRKPGSSSSQESDDFFSIPRPRLIVPVHTYARKRRTGNLVADPVETLKNDDEEDKGRFLILYYFVLHYMKNCLYKKKWCTARLGVRTNAIICMLELSRVPIRVKYNDSG